MNNKHLFGYPVTGRYGLGNMLFPWARCYLWCADNKIPMIAPTWTKLKLGPYLRRERDKRNYQRFFHNDSYIFGFRKLFLLVTLPKVSEQENDPINDILSNRNTIRTFEGWPGMFEPLRGKSNELHRELVRITRHQYLPRSVVSTPFIGIHVRRGDFRVPDETDLQKGVVNIRIPLEWYIKTLSKLLDGLEFQAKVLVFSDGSDDELADLLAMPGVERSKETEAITDMLLLSEAQIMIASGSTFSMWASFLGQVPCIWYPGQCRQRLLNSNSNEMEPEVATETSIPESFLAIAKDRLKHSKSLFDAAVNPH
jgi:hypothetical protein